MLDAAHQGARERADRADPARRRDPAAAPEPVGRRATCCTPPTREEQIAEMKKVTLADVRKFHDQFYGANYGVFAVVGPVEQAAVQKAAAELLGSWNTRRRTSRSSRRSRRRRRSTRRSKRRTRPTRSSWPACASSSSENDPDYPAMLLAGYMFGGPITSRISDRIRNREGLSYGANARIAVPAEGDRAMLSGTVSLNPVNGPKVGGQLHGRAGEDAEGGLHRRGGRGGEEGVSRFADGRRGRPTARCWRCWRRTSSSAAP